jgi:plasmid stabilization system protein ParE
MGKSDKFVSVWPAFAITVMSRRIKWSPAAKQNLKDLKEYISNNNRDVAKRFGIAAKSASLKLAEFPEMAGIWETTNPNCRACAFGQFLISKICFFLPANRSRD